MFFSYIYSLFSSPGYSNLRDSQRHISIYSSCRNRKADMDSSYFSFQRNQSMEHEAMLSLLSSSDTGTTSEEALNTPTEHTSILHQMPHSVNFEAQSPVLFSGTFPPATTAIESIFTGHLVFEPCINRNLLQLQPAYMINLSTSSSPNSVCSIFQSQATPMELTHYQAMQLISTPTHTTSSYTHGFPSPEDFTSPTRELPGSWEDAGSSIMRNFEASNLPLETSLIAQSTGRIKDAVSQSCVDSDAPSCQIQELVGKQTNLDSSTEVYDLHCQPRSSHIAATKPKIKRIPSGIHKCSYPECVFQNPFKRLEHLKRHVLT